MGFVFHFINMGVSPTYHGDSYPQQCIYESVLLISTKTCCGNQCCQHFDRDLALLIRKKYWEKTFEMRKEYEMTAIRNALQLEGAQNIVVVEGTAICLEAWRILHSRGKSQFSELKKMVKGGLTDPAHGNKGKRRMSEKSFLGICFNERVY